MARAHVERDIQLAVMGNVRALMKALPLLAHVIHVPNGGKRDAKEAAILNGMGVKAGVSDLLFLAPAWGYSGLALELKAPGESPTKLQMDFLRDQFGVGWLSAWTDSAGAASELLAWYAKDGQCVAPPAFIGIRYVEVE